MTNAKGIRGTGESETEEMSEKLSTFHNSFAKWMYGVETAARKANTKELGELLGEATAISPQDSFTLKHCKRIIAEWVILELAMREFE